MSTACGTPPLIGPLLFQPGVRPGSGASNIITSLHTPAASVRPPLSSLPLRRKKTRRERLHLHLRVWKLTPHPAAFALAVMPNRERPSSRSAPATVGQPRPILQLSLDGQNGSPNASRPLKS